MPPIVIQLLVTLINLYSLVLLARIILSWVPNVGRDNPLVKILYDVTEPVLQPVRDALPDLGMIDISPIIVFVVLRLIQGFLLGAS